MTLLEKCRAEHPELDEEKIVTWMCPCDFGLEKLDDGCGQVGAVQEICRECWNRPADAAGGGESQPVCSAAVEKCEEKREPEAFFGNRKAVGPADAAGKSCHSEALRAEESRTGSDVPGDPSQALRMTEKEGGAGNGG